MNKRAQLFTILSIMLISLMFISFEIFSTIHERQAVKSRVSTMDSFLRALEKNLERQMYISGFRIIFLAEDKITTGENYIPDIDSFFNESFFNGTVDGIPELILTGATYTDLINSVNAKAAKINVNITMENSTIIVEQEDPWHVKFTLISDFVMRDRQNLALWSKQQNISSLIPVVEFEDPLYIIGSHATISRKITQTIYDGDYVNLGDVSNLSDHANKGYYANNTDAPSFLKRLEGDFSTDPNGIESFINTNELAAQGFSVDADESVIDHLYFNSVSDSGSSVAGMPAWFRIDDGHKARYQLS